MTFIECTLAEADHAPHRASLSFDPAAYTPKMSAARDGEWHEWPFEPLPVLSSLGTHGVEYVLIGGLAALLQGSPLPTYDIDIAPAPSGVNARRLGSALAYVHAIALTNDTHDDVQQTLRKHSNVGFSTPFGYIDLHSRPAGFDTYGALRRHAVPLELEPDLTILVSPLRDIIRSRTAAGDHRQLPALEATLELARAAGHSRTLEAN